MADDFDSEAMKAFVQELTRSFADLKKEITELGQQAGTGMKKGTEETDKFGKTVEHHARNIKGMKEETGGLVAMLRGPVGLATAFYTAAKAMENFAVGQLQLRNLATDLGLAETAISRMRIQASAAGIDMKSFDQQLGSLNAKLDNLRTYKTASQFYKDIAANDPALAKRLLDLEAMQKREEAIKAIQEKNAREGPRTKLYLTEKTGVSQSTFEALEKNKTGMVQPKQFDAAEMEKYNKDVTNITTTFNNAWDTLMHEMVKSTNEALEKWKDIFSGKRSLLDTLKEGSWLGGKDNFKNRFGDWGDEGPEGDRLPPNAQLRSGTYSNLAMLTTAKDDLEIQKDSNRVLQEIRDLLDPTKNLDGIGAAGGGGGGGGGGDRGGGGSRAPGPGGDRRPGSRSRPGDGDSETPDAIPVHSLAQDRERYAKELEDKPWLKEKILGIAAGENKDPTSNLAVIESMMNRASARGISLEQAAKLVRERGGYYAGYDPGSLRRPKIREMIEGNLQKALAGSNVSDYATDNSSGGLAERERRTGAFTFRKGYGGESFFSPGTSGGAKRREQYERWRRSVEDAETAGNVPLPRPRPEGLDVPRADSFNDRFGGLGDASRSSIDRALRSSGYPATGLMGSASIAVDFNGIPPGVKTDADMDGFFKKLRINRTPQALMAGGASIPDPSRFTVD